MYSVPYLTLSEAQQLNLERIHMAGINTALAVPPQTSTSETFDETAALPIMDCVQDCILGQLVRLHRTAPGRYLLEEVMGHSESTVAPIIMNVVTNGLVGDILSTGHWQI